MEGSDLEGKREGKWLGILDYIRSLSILIVLGIILNLISNNYVIYNVSGESMQPTLSDGGRILVGYYNEDNVNSGKTNKSEDSLGVGSKGSVSAEESKQYKNDKGILRGEIVVFDAQQNMELSNERHNKYVEDTEDTVSSSERYLVKRVVALPGDLVEFDGSVYKVNGEVIEDEESYLKFGIGGSIIKDGYKIESESNVMGKVSESDVNNILNREWGMEGNKVPDNKYLVMGDNRSNSNDSRQFGLIDGKSIEGRVVMEYGKDFQLFVSE